MRENLTYGLRRQGVETRMESSSQAPLLDPTKTSMTDCGSLHNRRRSRARGYLRPEFFTRSLFSCSSVRTWSTRTILSLPLSRAQSQVPHSHQVVRRSDEREVPGDLFRSHVSRLPEDSHRLHPAEDLLHPFSN